jgi:hypothetical protein
MLPGLFIKLSDLFMILNVEFRSKGYYWWVFSRINVEPSTMPPISKYKISLSLRRTSAPIHLTSILGVLGTQETFCIVIAGLLERDTFDLFLPEFDKPWVIHLRETCCCSTNLCTWRPNTVYKNRSVRRHHMPRLKRPALKKHYRRKKQSRPPESNKFYYA